MSNPVSTDRRFDKPTIESLVDLINLSNRTYIRYDEIEIVDVVPIAGSETELYNTTVTVKLAKRTNSPILGPMTYGRLDIAQYIPYPLPFEYDGAGDPDMLFDQLRALHHVWLSPDDSEVVLSEVNLDGSRSVSFRPKPDHPVWTGVLEVVAVPSNHLELLMPVSNLNGFDLNQLNA